MRLDGPSYEHLCRLFEADLSDREIARRTGFSQGSVSRWRRSPAIPAAVRRAELEASWSVTVPAAYCYLLGAYLGDGTVYHQSPHHWSLRVVNDQRYPAISTEIMDAMQTVFPEANARRWCSSVGASEILHISHPAVHRAFPQHGPGRKHERPIALADWQRALTQAEPAALIRGLIHSDGCRTLNRFQTELPSGRVASYCYVRYFFTNESADIRRIFTDHCELLGIHVTQPTRRNLAVSRRASVATLERLIGPKR